MKGLGETSPFHRFTNPQREKSVYFWSWGTYLLFTDHGIITILEFLRDTYNFGIMVFYHFTTILAHFI